MMVLVACEESQEVCKAFRARGHEAYSCDIQECSGGHPEWHIMGDALAVVNGRCSFQTMDGAEHEISGTWDMLIAHPPCTFLSNAGARWLYKGGKLNQERYQKGLAAKEFLLKFFNADCLRIAVENPIPSSVCEMPQYTQTVQPYEHGEPWSKKTCLWLKKVEVLKPSNIVTDYKPFCSSGSYSGTHDPRYRGANIPSGDINLKERLRKPTRTSSGSLHGRISRRTKRSSAVFRCGSALLVGE